MAFQERDAELKFGVPREFPERQDELKFGVPREHKASQHESYCSQKGMPN